MPFPNYPVTPTKLRTVSSLLTTADQPRPSKMFKIFHSNDQISPGGHVRGNYNTGEKWRLAANAVFFDIAADQVRINLRFSDER